MNGLRSGALLLGFAIAAFYLTACTSNRVGLIKQSPVHVAQLDREAFNELYTRPFQFNPVGKGLKPMTGRLLVRVRSVDINRVFKYAPLGDRDVRRIFPYLRLFPVELPLRDAKEVDQLADGHTLLRLYLTKASTPKRIRQLLMRTPFELSEETSLTRTNQERLDMVVVKVRLDQFSLHERQLGFLRYPELKRYGDLHKTFHDIDVRSIRRVFRMVERPIAKGTYQVVSMKSLMKEAKAKYPQRARRGYEHVQLPHNMENWFLLRFDRKADLVRVAKVLSDRPEIEEVLFDYPVQFHQLPETEPLFPNQWALKDGWGINVVPVWPTTAANTPVVVAVIGTGIKEDLVEFEGRIWSNPDEVADDGLDNDSNGFVDDISGITTNDAWTGGTPFVFLDHETRVAGIIAAAVNDDFMTGAVGCADVKLMNISLGAPACGSGVAEAIAYASLNGADIANMSFGTPPSILIWDAIQIALTRNGGGMTMVASAGNGNRRVSEDYVINGAHYPAWYDGVLNVGGTDQNGQLWQDISGAGSNYGTGLDFVAPAEAVQTITYLDLTQTTTTESTISGTSASAALASAVSALLLGSYPALGPAEIRSWLRTTAIDIYTPGDDEYSGAGLLNAQNAFAQGTPNPIVADILVEKIGETYAFNAGVDNAVAGDPDLGITIHGPIDGPWQLHYGISDSPAPNEWIPMSVPPALANSELDIPRFAVGPGGGDPLFWQYYIDVADDGIDFTTDNLNNRQIYTIRLSASDVLGNIYTAYDWFMPMRAMIVYPVKDTPIPVRWGWPEIDGLVDTRDEALYDIAIVPETGTPDPNLRFNLLAPNACFNQLWEGYQEPKRDTNFVRLTVAEGTYENLGCPTFTTPPTTEGDYRIELTAHTPSGLAELDTQEIVVDSTSFDLRWQAEIGGLSYWKSLASYGLEVADMSGSGEWRILANVWKSFMSFTPEGDPVLDLEFTGAIMHHAVFHAPLYLVDDLDNDGTGSKEIVIENVAGNNYDERELWVLNRDGSTFNSNWPQTFITSSSDWPGSLGKISSGDIDGNGSKEIVFWANHKNEQTPKLHALNLNGVELSGFPVAFAPEDRFTTPIVGDIDADGMAEIVLDPKWKVYEMEGGNLQEKPGWPPAHTPVLTFGNGGTKIADVVTGGGRELVIYGIEGSGDLPRNYIIDVLNENGVRLPGNWPVVLDEPENWPVTAQINRGDMTKIFIDIAQIVPGGDSEIVAASHKVRVLDANGVVVTGIPEIDLGGECRGVKVINVDSDNQPEIVALVMKYSDDEGWLNSGWGELVAYDLNGAPLSDGDDRWPVYVGFDPHMALDNTVAIEDIDDDGQLEIVTLLNPLPNKTWPDGFYWVRSGMQHSRIEVLNIR
ncbi:hypothetical protein D1BOALGB6SA_513 [Olavius sp. associated proteobacterium Delta 1]|nr:hypothetical protein D1BOALGB6SA_513 [Olavius sp. associated proteobacterium Delta 1]